MALLALLMLSTVLYNRESLLFCERALSSETEALRKDTALKGPVKFNDVCPEIRQRVETSVNKMLEIILALLVPIVPHNSDKS
jgi:leucyl-tRNA synthetase